MIQKVLAVPLLIGTGTAAGVLFAVALGVVPALLAMPVDRYLHVHQLIGPRWDPTLPIVVVATTLLDVALALMAPLRLCGLFAASALLLFGVSVVSHLCNVPLNRSVRGTDPEHVPAGWIDPRPQWRRWHNLRTGLALAALLVNAAAVTWL